MIYSFFVSLLSYSALHFSIVECDYFGSVNVFYNNELSFKLWSQVW